MLEGGFIACCRFVYSRDFVSLRESGGMLLFWLLFVNRVELSRVKCHGNKVTVIIVVKT